VDKRLLNPPTRPDEKTVVINVMKNSIKVSAHVKGSALILAILVAGIVAVLAVQFAQAFLVKATLAENRLMQSRFSTYLSGAEALARQVLWQDAQTDMTVFQIPLDHLKEPWASILPPLATDDGYLEVVITDAQGLFNLNNLSIKTAWADDLTAPLTLRFSAPQKQFIRLLQSFPDLPVSEAEAVAITEAVIDWIDEDDQVSGPSGAESLYYQSDVPVQQAANQHIHDISELRMIRHLSQELVQRLSAHVVALPMATSLNINTASFAVLSTLNSADDLSPADEQSVLSVLQLRELSHFQEVAEFLAAGMPIEMQNTQGEAPDDTQGKPENDSIKNTEYALYSVSSRFFQARFRVLIADEIRYMRALLYRDEQGVRTLGRYYGDHEPGDFGSSDFGGGGRVL